MCSIYSGLNSHPIVLKIVTYATIADTIHQCLLDCVCDALTKVLAHVYQEA